MTKKNPITLFGFHQAVIQDRVTKTLYPLLVTKAYTPNLTEENIPLNGGSSSFAWDNASGYSESSLSLTIAQYDLAILRYFGGDGINYVENVSGDPNGHASELVNKAGSSMADTVTGIISTSVVPGQNPKFGNYYIKAVSSNTVHIYLDNSLDGLTEHDNYGRITSTPITINTGTTVIIPGTGLQLTGGSGIINLTPNDIASFYARPKNTYNFEYLLGKDAKPEFSLSIYTEKLGLDKYRAWHFPRVKANGFNPSGTAKEWSELESELTILYDSAENYAAKFIVINGLSSFASESGTIPSLPINLSLPTIIGVNALGETLTATTGTWDNNPTSFTYQWKRSGITIAGANSSSYTIALEDTSETITCDITAINISGTVTVTSNALTGTVPVNIIAPVASGTVGRNEVINVTNGSWDNNPSSFSYQLKLDGIEVVDATSNTYTIPESYTTGNYSWEVTAVNTLGSATASSNILGGYSPIEFINEPTISGTVLNGEVITISPATATGNPTPTSEFLIYVDDILASTQTELSYTLVQANPRDVYVVQRATNILGTADSNASNVLINTSSSFDAPLLTASSTYNAFGFERLIENYTGNVVRLKRLSDDTESDFGTNDDYTFNLNAVNIWRDGAAVNFVHFKCQTGSTKTLDGYGDIPFCNAAGNVTRMGTNWSSTDGQLSLSGQGAIALNMSGANQYLGMDETDVDMTNGLDVCTLYMPMNRKSNDGYFPGSNGDVGTTFEFRAENNTTSSSSNFLRDTIWNGTAQRGFRNGPTGTSIDFQTASNDGPGGLSGVMKRYSTQVITVTCSNAKVGRYQNGIYSTESIPDAGMQTDNAALTGGSLSIGHRPSVSFQDMESSFAAIILNQALPDATKFQIHSKLALMAHYNHAMTSSQLEGMFDEIVKFNTANSSTGVLTGQNSKFAAQVKTTGTPSWQYNHEAFSGITGLRRDDRDNEDNQFESTNDYFTDAREMSFLAIWHPEETPIYDLFSYTKAAETNGYGDNDDCAFSMGRDHSAVRTRNNVDEDTYNPNRFGVGYGFSDATGINSQVMQKYADKFSVSEWNQTATFLAEVTIPEDHRTDYNHTGDGTTTNFSFGFKAAASTDVQVYVDNVLQTSGYTVVFNSGNNGGSVNFTAAPASSAAISIRWNGRIPAGDTMVGTAALNDGSVTQWDSESLVNVFPPSPELRNGFDLGYTGTGDYQPQFAIYSHTPNSNYLYNAATEEYNKRATNNLYLGGLGGLPPGHIDSSVGIQPASGNHTAMTAAYRMRTTDYQGVPMKGTYVLFAFRKSAMTYDEAFKVNLNIYKLIA
ncbi:MAG: hypothetical protein AAGI66_07335 [Cyanobacteria bacterium P01_H01_bin.74]